MIHQQPTLFAQDAQTIDLPDGTLSLFPQWLDAMQSADCFKQLYQQVAWEQSPIVIYGKVVKIPRLNAWYGDSGCAYRYSGKRFTPRPWLPLLQALRESLEDRLKQSFNSVLVNCYRDGQDSVAWHSDDEPELGRNPVVASISLGAERTFQLRHRFDKNQPRQSLVLGHGSLLLMGGSLQHYWQHCVPKTRRDVNARINLTFRQVID